LNNLIFIFIFKIAISSITETGNKPWYLEECSGTLAAAYSSGQGGNTDHEIVSYCILNIFFVYHSSFFYLNRLLQIYIMVVQLIILEHQQQHH